MLRRLGPVVLVVAGVAAPGAHAAAHIQGTYALHVPGKTTATDFDSTPADGAWTVDTTPAARDRQGELPATLTQATHGPLVQPCAGDPAFGTTTTSMSGVVDSAASFKHFLRLDLLRGRGLVTAYADPFNLGVSRLTTQMRCDSDYGGSSDDAQDYPVSAAFSTVSSPDDWKVRKAGTNRWTATGTQQLTPAPGPDDAGPSTATLSLTMTGSPAALRAACKIPTPHDLRRARSRKAALRILRRAGMKADPTRTSLSVRYLPKGRFFVLDQAVDPYTSCGVNVPLVRNVG